MQDDKIRVLIVDDAADTRDSIKKLLQFDKAIEVIGTIGTAKDAIQMAVEKQPHVVLMDINMPDMDGIAATEGMRKKVPFVQVIILSVQDDLNFMRRAMMAGARDFLTKPPDIDELVSAIHRAYDLAKEEIGKMGSVNVTGMTAGGEAIYGSAIFGKVVMVYSPKGGTGVTTLATNLAVCLNTPSSQVVLVDGSLQFGDVTVFLNEQPRLSITDLAPRADELDPEIVNEVLINHSQTGLRILAASPRPEQADKITGDQFIKILRYLRRLFHFTIIDTSSYLTDPIISAMDEADYGIFVERIRAYMLKALREAKVNSSWINPDTAYEEAMLAFVDAVMDRTSQNRFLGDFISLQQRISHYGMFNSLSQTLLKITSPGVPDFYQGTELWDFSLVDPDNRRLVDYGIRMEMLEEIKRMEAGFGRKELVRRLMADKEDGRIKLYLTYRLVNFRRENRGLFEKGEYLPLEARGTLAENVCAFARRGHGKSLIIAVPRFVSKIVPWPELPLGEKVWPETSLLIPFAPAGARYRQVLTGESVTALDFEGNTILPLAEVFADCPVAALEADEG